MNKAQTATNKAWRMRKMGMKDGNTQQAYKKINVKPGTFDRLRGFGKYGDTADDIVNRLMNAAGEAHNQV